MSVEPSGSFVAIMEREEAGMSADEIGARIERRIAKRSARHSGKTRAGANTTLEKHEHLDTPKG